MPHKDPVKRKAYAADYAKRNSERMNAQARASYAKNPIKKQAQNKIWKEENPEAVRAHARKAMQKLRVKNREKFRLQSKFWRAANPQRVYQHGLKARYGKIGAMPTKPCPAVCECCGKPPGRKRLSVDHCHSTKQFRGWLCSKCNTAIGSLGDTLSGVMNAVRYLQAVQSNAARTIPA